MSNLTSPLTGGGDGIGGGDIGDVDNIIFLDGDTTSGPDTVTIPTANIVEGTIIIITDAFGNAGTNTLTVDTQGGQTIEGVLSVTITSNFGAIRLRVKDGNLLSW